VVGNSGVFSQAEFATRIGKWVRRGQVQTSQDWMTAEIVPNRAGPEMGHSASPAAAGRPSPPRTPTVDQPLRRRSAEVDHKGREGIGPLN
jgi:hypothetical protein